MLFAEIYYCQVLNENEMWFHYLRIMECCLGFSLMFIVVFKTLSFFFYQSDHRLRNLVFFTLVSSLFYDDRIWSISNCVYMMKINKKSGTLTCSVKCMIWSSWNGGYYFDASNSILLRANRTERRKPVEYFQRIVSKGVISCVVVFRKYFFKQLSSL